MISCVSSARAFPLPFHANMFRTLKQEVAHLDSREATDNPNLWLSWERTYHALLDVKPRRVISFKNDVCRQSFCVSHGDQSSLICQLSTWRGSRPVKWGEPSTSEKEPAANSVYPLYFLPAIVDQTSPWTGPAKGPNLISLSAQMKDFHVGICFIYLCTILNRGSERQFAELAVSFSAKKNREGCGVSCRCFSRIRERHEWWMSF